MLATIPAMAKRVNAKSPLQRMTKVQLMDRVRELERQLKVATGEEVDEEAPLTPQQLQLAQRNADIVTSLGRGLSTVQVAQTFGISERQVRNIMERWRRENPGLRQRAVESALAVVDEFLEQYAGAAEELALIAATAKTPTARVAAIRARMDAITRRIDTLQAIGVLPNDLGAMRLDIDVRHVADVIVKVLQEEQIPMDTTSRILAALSGAVEN